MSSPGPKQRIFIELANIAQAIADTHRLEILEHLAQGECSVEDLVARIGLSVANTSRHLQILRRARLVEPRRDGRRMIYSLIGETEIIRLTSALGRIGERNNAEIQLVISSYFRARDELEPVSHADLLTRLKSGSVVLLDVRPEDEFAKGHLPGAVNIPLAELERRMAGLPRDLTIIAYCRGPYCVLSVEATAALRGRGFDAYRLEEGYPEWKAASLPVEE